MKRKLCLIIPITAALTGCTSHMRMFEDSDNGYVMLTGDAEGIRAYNDGLNGLITNARGNPDIKSAYWQNREKEADVKIFRFRKKGEK